MRLLTLKSVLVAVDLDDASVPALRTASRLAALAGAELHLLHVRLSPDLNRGPELKRHFDEVVPDAANAESVEEMVGRPAAVIVEHAVKVNADAIILGPHRRSGGDAVMGSTAAGVVRNASCPCLVVTGELRLPLQSVVVSVDLSDATAGSVSVALTWASALRPRSDNARLSILHVSETASSSAEQRMHEESARARPRWWRRPYRHSRSDEVRRRPSRCDHQRCRLRNAGPSGHGKSWQSQCTFRHG
jgi:nucleotide-binding universal stress UspA family protein